MCRAGQSQPLRVERCDCPGEAALEIAGPGRQFRILHQEFYIDVHANPWRIRPSRERQTRRVECTQHVPAAACMALGSGDTERDDRLLSRIHT